MMAQTGALINIVKTKIEFVKTQTNELHGLLDAFINKETAAATAVIVAEKQDLNKIRGINSRLDTVLEFLLGKCADVDGFTSGATEDLHQQQLHTSTSASSSMITSSDISEIFGRIQMLEATELDKCAHEKKLRELEEKLDNLVTEIADKEKMKSSTSGSFEKKRKIQKGLESEKKRLLDLETKLQQLIVNNSHLSQDLNSRFSSVKDSIQRIEDECTDFRSSLSERKEEAFFFKKTMEDLTSQLKALKNFYGQSLTTVADLASRLDTIEEDKNSLIDCRKSQERRIAELQDRVIVVEEHRNKDLDSYKGKLEETDNLYKQVCEMVASKMKQLLRLQEILSKYHRTVEMQEQVALETGGMSANVSDSTQGVCNPGYKKQRVPVGFTAYWGDHSEISGETTLIFTDVLCNEGNCYDSSSGNFTAPYTGLYLASLTLRQRDVGTVDAHIRLAKSRHFVARGTRPVCKLLTNADKTSCCETGVVRMKAGDKLFVFTMEVGLKPKLSFYSSFSCILIG